VKSVRSVDRGADDRFAVARHNGQKVLAPTEGIGEYRGSFRQTIAVERLHRNSGVSAYTILAAAEERIQDDGNVFCSI
jgi:hypothetical protein